MARQQRGDDGGAAPERRTATTDPRVLGAELATAVRFLTVVRVPGAAVPIGESALFFPLVGLGLGAVVLAADRLLPAGLPSLVRAALLLVVLAGLGGGRLSASLARAVAGVGARDRTEALARMRAPRVPAAGVAAVLVVAAVKLWSLGTLAGPPRTRALLFAPMLARWVIVALAFGSRPARRGGEGDAIVRALTFREFALASVFALGPTLAYAEAWGLAVILTLALVTIGCRVVVHRTLGGVSGAVIGALGEIAEGLAFGLFALAAPAAGGV